jgi:hypothetical protein
MKELAKAICSRFSSDPMSTSFTGIYNTLAPETSVFPYLVFSFISQTTDWTFTERFEDLLVQFDIYSDQVSPVQVTDLYNLLIGDSKAQQGFDFAEFSVNDYVLLWFTRESSSLQRWEIEGKRVWNYTVTYRVKLEKT